MGARTLNLGDSVFLYTGVKKLQGGPSILLIYFLPDLFVCLFVFCLFVCFVFFLIYSSIHHPSTEISQHFQGPLGLLGLTFCVLRLGEQ